MATPKAKHHIYFAKDPVGKIHGPLENIYPGSHYGDDWQNSRYSFFQVIDGLVSTAFTLEEMTVVPLAENLMMETL